jgi:hypothetical protein
MDPVVYVRACPEKGSVPRYGTGTHLRTNVIIGAVRDPNDPRKLVHSSELVAIPAAEWRRFRREYLRAVQSGALVIVRAAKAEPTPKESKAADKGRSKEKGT